MPTIRVTIIAAGCAALVLGCATASRAGDTASLVPSPQALIELADLSSVSVSPDGQTAVFREERASVATNNYTSKWFARPLARERAPFVIADGGAPLMTSSGSYVYEAPQWSHDSQWVYFRALVDGAVQVWRARVDGGGSEQLTHEEGDIKSFFLSDSGDRLIFSVGPSRSAVMRAEDEERDNGVLIDDTIEIGQGLYRAAEYNGRLTSRRKLPTTFERLPLLHAGHSEWKSYSLTDFTALPISTAEADAIRADAMVETVAGERVSGARTAPDGSGRILYVAGTFQTVRLHAAQGTAGEGMIECAFPECQGKSLDGAVWRPGSDEVMFSSHRAPDGLGQTLNLWNTRTGALRQVTKSDGLLAENNQGFGSTCAAGPNEAVCITADPDAPPAVEAIDYETGTRRVLYAPNTALAESSTIHGEFLAWQDELGNPYTGILFRPPGGAKGRVPLFINYYFCAGYLRGGVGEEWPFRTLAQAGIAALCVNKTPVIGPTLGTNRDKHLEYEQARTGVEAVIRKLNQEGIIDPGRVGMGGFSQGSETTLWTIGHSDAIAVASTTAAMFTEYAWWSFLQSEKTRWPAKLLWRLGPPDEVPERWRLMSPSYWAQDIHTPLLMQMPEQEYMLMIETATRIRDGKGAVELFAFPFSSHMKAAPRQRLAAMQRNVDWYRFWLQDYADPDPRKAAQYDRWRLLRCQPNIHARLRVDCPAAPGN